MQPLSNDLLVSSTPSTARGSPRQLAARFSVNTSTITRSSNSAVQTGSFEQAPQRQGRTDLDRLAERLRKLVEETPDATLEALKQKLGVSGSRMIICRAYGSSGCHSKKSPHAAERDTPGVKRNAASSPRMSDDRGPAGLFSWTSPFSWR